jgi:two-component sensor histidine kinase
LDLSRAVATIPEILPETERIVAVMDESAVGKARASQLRALEGQLPEGTKIELWNSFLEEELYGRVKTLKPGAAILYLPVQRDRTGTPLAPAEVARKLAEASPVPVFSHFDTLLGTGVVGGYLVSARQLGLLMGRTAAYGDRGAPETQEEYSASCMGYYFDARALRRWKIAESRLPIGSKILFEERSFVQEYGPYLALVIVLFVLETALVLALIRSSVRRKRAMRLLDEERANLEAKVLQRTSDLELLFKEFQHRVKNGLGIITSLVSLEAGRTDDEGLRRVLSKLESRVAALATLYDMLYETGGVMEVAADGYLGSLLENLGVSLGGDSRGIKVATRMESVPIDIKRAIPLALLANELVTNAFKYAFPGGRGGSIEVTLAAEGANLRFAVVDDGVGLGEGFDPESGSGLGMTLVLLLSRQLDGTLTWTSGPGAGFTLVFPE